jgi:hypothetical protein
MIKFHARSRHSALLFLTVGADNRSPIYILRVKSMACQKRHYVVWITRMKVRQAYWMCYINAVRGSEGSEDAGGASPGLKIAS